MFLIGFLACVCDGVWVTRYAIRSDFFCITAPESFESWLVDEEQGTSACLSSPSSTSNSSSSSVWRMARLDNVSNVVSVELHDDANCSSAVPSLLWSEAVGLCRRIAPASENLFVRATVSPERPRPPNVVERERFLGTACGGSVRLVEGMSVCAQTTQIRPSGISWLKTKCDISARRFQQQLCAVADCKSGLDEESFFFSFLFFLFFRCFCV